MFVAFQAFWDYALVLNVFVVTDGTDSILVLDYRRRVVWGRDKGPG